MSALESTLRFFGFSEEDEDTNNSAEIIHQVNAQQPVIHNIQPKIKEK